MSSVGSDSAGAGSSESQRPKRAERYSSKELASKQRLAELVEAHKAGKAGSTKPPGTQSAQR